jgi:hypothetical protein
MAEERVGSVVVQAIRIRCSTLFCVAIRYYYYWWGGTKSLGTAATSGLLYKSRMIDEDDCGAIGGMKIGWGNRSIRRKPVPAPLCPPLRYEGESRNSGTSRGGRYYAVA